MMTSLTNPIGDPPPLWQLNLIPILTVLVASMLPAVLPVIAEWAILPPLGLMIFLSWRLLRPEIWPAWVGLAFGLWDDLFSGQPIGSAIGLWTLASVAIAYLDSRLLWRNFWQDWEIAAAMIAFVLFIGAWLAHPSLPLQASMRQVVMQCVISICLFPLFTRIVARIDAIRIRLR